MAQVERLDQDVKLRIFLLGTFRVLRQGSTIVDSAWQRRSACALVKLLALSPGRSLHRDQVLEILWPELALDPALNNLRKALHAARRALEPELEPFAPSSFLTLKGDVLSFGSIDLWVDADHFERLAAAAHGSGDLEAVEKAIAAYGGELVPGDRYMAWAEPRRSTLAEWHIQLLLEAAHLRRERRDHEKAIAHLQEVLRHDPAREEAHRELMRIYSRTGHRQQAVRQYQICRTTLRDELDVEPDEQTETILREVLGPHGSCSHIPGAPADLNTGGGERGRDLADARARLGEALTTMGRYDEARIELEKAAAMYEARDDAENLGLVIAQIGRVHFLQSRPRLGIDRITPFLDRDDLSPRAAAALHASLAPLYWIGGRYAEQLRESEKAEDLAFSLGADDIRAQATAWRGVALLALECVDEGIPILEEAAALAEQVNDFITASRALSSIGVAFQERGDFARQAPYLERAVVAAERSGDPLRIAFMRYRRGWHSWMVGAWKEASRDFEGAMSVSERLPECWVTPYASCGLAWLRLVAGDWNGADRYAERALSLATSGGDVRAIAAVHGLLAELELRTGKPRAARARLELALETPGLTGGDMALFLTTQAHAHLALGDLDTASRVIEHAEACAASGHARTEMFEVMYVKGLLSKYKQEWNEAEGHFTEAAALARSMMTPYKEARAVEAHGVLRMQMGQEDRGRDKLRAANAIYSRLGAVADSQRVTDLLYDEV